MKRREIVKNFSGIGRYRGSGFVLIMVIVLLALVTILVVVTSIMARVERRAAWNTARIELARQNALFALDVAIGQLQREAGPDQRVTARADILSSGTSIDQPEWTGVWKTYDSGTGGFQYLDGQTGAGTTGYNIRAWSTIGSPAATGTNPLATGSNMVWLVSGGTNNLIVNPTTTSSAAWMPNSVVLAKNLNAGSANPEATGTASVSVPLVPLMGSTVGGVTNASGTSGKYAYWVSDEGVKARVNLADPTYGIVAQTSGSNFVENQLHFLTPQANVVQNGLLGAANTTDLRSPQYTSDLTTRVSTLQSLALVGGTLAPITGMSGTGAAFFSPDATTYSRGVMADVRCGGLKVDLSQVFEDPSQFLSFVSSFKLWQPTQPAWATGDEKVWSILAPSFDNSGTETTAEFGPRWQSLYNYYSMYRNNVLTSGQGTGAARCNYINAYSQGNPGTAAPQVDESVFSYYSQPTGSGTGVVIQEIGEYYLPHILGFEVKISLLSVPVPGPGSKYQLETYAEPGLILYNPYNVILSASNSNPYTFNLTSNMLGNASHTWSIKIVGSDPQTVEVNKPIGWGGVIKSGSASVSALSFTTGTSALIFQPGEIKVVGLGSSAPVKCPAGNLLAFSGSGGVPLFSQWQYVYADSSTNGVIWTGTCPNAAGDNVVISTGSAQFADTGGIYNVARTSIGLWPENSDTNTQSLGRFYNASPLVSGSSVTIGPLSSGTAIEFFQFVVRVKGLTPQSSQARGTPVFAACDGTVNPLPLMFDSPILDINFGLNKGGTDSTLQIANSGPPAYDSYWGVSDAGWSSSDPSFLILHDLPRQPMISLGQFMHMAMRNSAFVGLSGSLGGIDTNSSSLPVGGSLADPFFPLNWTYNNNPGNPNIGGVACFDDNFLMNQALFDTYYFSTVPPSSAAMAVDPGSSYSKVMPAAFTSGSTGCTDVNIQNGTVILPNARMRVYSKNGQGPALSALQNYRTSSANVMMDGAFNVNSTSVAAWAALLGSLSGNTVNYLSNGTFLPLSSGTLQNPIFRLMSPTFWGPGSGAVNSLGAPSLWGGINSLSNAQVLALATSIVNQVKLRGPFLSMADFLNRRLDPNSNGLTTGFGLAGALQAAIDNTLALTGTDLNNTQLAAFGASTSGTIQGSRGVAPASIAAQLPANTAVGVPGWLMQQDLVQCFSPVMTVRSDTFVVRCYGESDNQATGATEGRAWCEAVVQRFPDYVDQADPALSGTNAYGTGLGDATPPYDRITNLSTNPATVNPIVDSINLTFGRRFKVISFRWLNETDL